MYPTFFKNWSIQIHNPATNPGMASPLLRQMYRITSSDWAAKKQIGSGFSRKKTELGPDVSQFWNFFKSGKKSDPGQMGFRVQDIGQKTWSVYEINWQNKTKNLLFKTYYSSIIFIIYLIQIGHCKDWKKKIIKPNLFLVIPKRLIIIWQIGRELWLTLRSW